ncbi:MAG TPA: amidohydrolase family protein [Steroidobacteraceae bacterium]|jgi:5-methylthioadenosine/S-adenosylhomocysteine deaminase
MSMAHADLRIDVRWLAPMTARGVVLEHHSMVVRDGRILDILPSSTAAERYSAVAVLQRASHLLMPGMINTHSDAAGLLFRGVRDGAADERFATAEFTRDGLMAAIAEMLKSGVTTFYDDHFFPEETARTVAEQGMRAVLGMPISETATPWARNASQSMTRSLRFRDEFNGHPLISTAFAPQSGNSLSDATFVHLATLADELDAGISMELHQSMTEISQGLALHGARPIERLWKLGLLTPAFNAVHMVHAAAADIEVAQRTGISISLCAQSDLQSGNGLPPIAAFAAAGIRLGLGTGSAAAMSQDLWGEMKLIALMSQASPNAAATAWDALAFATRGGAGVMNLDGEVGTLEAGKWADLCCVDLSGPGIQPLRDPITQLVLSGGRDIVSDVWVAGRQLLSVGELTRLDWPEVAARSAGWAARMGYS